jgi:hypothetical protein
MSNLLQEKEDQLLKIQENILKNSSEIKTLLKELEEDVFPFLNKDSVLKSLGDVVIQRSKKIQEIQRLKKEQKDYSTEAALCKPTIQGKNNDYT